MLHTEPAGPQQRSSWPSVLGSGKTYTKADLPGFARTRRVLDKHQESSDQSAWVWGNTAVATAKLWLKGFDAGKPFDSHVLFGDTCVRTPSGGALFSARRLCRCPDPRTEERTASL